MNYNYKFRNAYARVQFERKIENSVNIREEKIKTAINVL